MFRRAFNLGNLGKRFNQSIPSKPLGPKPLGSKPLGSKPLGIKALISEYGYSALGVYVGLSFIDLPICFFAVHSLGEERTERYKNAAKQVFGYGRNEVEMEVYLKEKAAAAAAAEETSAGGLNYAQFFTEFIVAYGIHKSLFFIRIPITAAITPGVVKKLRQYGFKVGKTVSAAPGPKVFDATAGNVAKFGKPPTKGQKGLGGIF